MLYCGVLCTACYIAVCCVLHVILRYCVLHVILWCAEISLEILRDKNYVKYSNKKSTKIKMLVPN